MLESPAHRVAATAAQSGIWTAQRLRSDDRLYACGLYLELDHVVEEVLSEAIRRAVDDTEALRTAFQEDADGALEQHVLARPPSTQTRLFHADPSGGAPSAPRPWTGWTGSGRNPGTSPRATPAATP